MKNIFTMTVIALLWCGCSGDRVEPVDPREITATASAKDVIVLQSTRKALTGTSFSGDARVLATTTLYPNGKGDYQSLHCNGIMTFDGSDDKKPYTRVDGGNNWFPFTENPPHTVYLSGFYPAEGWVGITPGANIKIETGDQTLKHPIDGKTDIMYAKEDFSLLGIDHTAELEFEHLLTLLKIKLVKPMFTSDVVVKSIKLVKTGAEPDRELPLYCKVKLEPPVAVTFGYDANETIPSIPCYLTDGTDDAFTNKTYTVTTDAAEAAYILAPSLLENETGTPGDYTLKVDYTIGDVEKTDVPVQVNLKADANNDYAGDTAGKAFRITLNFTYDKITAEAEIVNWVELGDYKTDVSSKPTKQLPTWAIDGLSNAYMVAPDKILTFPVSRAYEFDKVKAEFTNTLRATGTDYADGEFTAEVLWADADVIFATPSVTGTGKNAVVMVKARSGDISGNAVVALKKKGTNDIVWSYHIWVTPYNGSATFTNTWNTNNNGKHFVFMDRNLGAKAAGLTEAARGLYYQWGRKDPFPGVNDPGTGAITIEETDVNKGTIAYTIRNPATFLTMVSDNEISDWFFAERKNDLWGHGTTKSVYDPCPSGWRVPANNGNPDATGVGSPWSGFAVAVSDLDTPNNIDGGWDYGYSWGDNAKYPVTGFRYGNNGAFVENISQNPCGGSMSASPVGNRAGGIFFIEGRVYLSYDVYRASGFPVRCVKEY